MANEKYTTKRDALDKGLIKKDGVFYTGSSTVNAVCSDRARFKKGTNLYCERYSAGGGWYANYIYPLMKGEE